MSEDLKRTEFEDWFSEGGTYPNAVERMGKGYKLMSAQSAWHAWQAAWNRCAPIMALMLKDAERFRMVVQRIGYRETGTLDGPMWALDLAKPSRWGNTDERFIAAVDAAIAAAPKATDA